MYKCLYFFSVFISITASSQVSLSDSIKTSRMEKLSEYIIVKLTQSSGIETFSVKTSQQKTRISPNAHTVTGISFSYKFIYFAAGRSLPFLTGNNDDRLRGKTRSGGVYMSATSHRLYGDFSYTTTKGYYLENTKDFNPSWNSSMPYIQFPYLKFKQYQAVVAYKSNPQYSLSAVTFQSERQLKSTGSFIPVFRGRYYINDNQEPPAANGFTQKGQNLELIAGLGYHYTFVAGRRFYLAAALTPGAGYVFSHITTRYPAQVVKGNQNNFIFRLDGRLGAGYTEKNFFAGLYVNASAAKFRQQHSTVITENDAAAFQVFTGYRLKAPNWIKKPVEKVERILPL